MFLGDGSGALGEPSRYPLKGSGVAIALGDLNGDGALDLATANNRSYNVSVALGVGDGTFQEVETFTAGNTHSVVLVDLDGDGHLIY